MHNLTVVEQRFIDYWRGRQHQQMLHDAAFKQQACQDLRQVISILKQRFDARRMLIFDSLLNERFSGDSDIDIAVEGISEERFFEALAAVNQCCDRWVDLKGLSSFPEVSELSHLGILGFTFLIVGA